MGRHLIRSFTTDFFQEPNTEAQFWVLGWLYSDGNNSGNSASVTVHSRDREVLEKIKSVTRASTKISERSDQNACVFRINSRHLCRRLTELGCMAAKSLIITYPAFIKAKEHHRAFLRGVFEGDGSLFRLNRRTSVAAEICSGSLAFVDGLQRVIKDVIGLDTVARRTSISQARRVCITGGAKNVYAFMSFLYDGAPDGLTLKRKRDAWLTFKARFDNPPPKKTWHINEGRRIAFYIRSPDGQVYHSNTMKPFTDEFGLRVGDFHSVVTRRKHYFTIKGWRLPTADEIKVATDNGTLINKEYPLIPAPTS